MLNHKRGGIIAIDNKSRSQSKQPVIHGATDNPATKTDTCDIVNITPCCKYQTIIYTTTQISTDNCVVFHTPTHIGMGYYDLTTFTHELVTAGSLLGPYCETLPTNTTRILLFYQSWSSLQEEKATDASLKQVDTLKAQGGVFGLEALIHNFIDYVAPEQEVTLNTIFTEWDRTNLEKKKHD